jgi:hypothetical protein
MYSASLLLTDVRSPRLRRSKVCPREHARRGSRSVRAIVEERRRPAEPEQPPAEYLQCAPGERGHTGPRGKVRSQRNARLLIAGTDFDGDLIDRGPSQESIRLVKRTVNAFISVTGLSPVASLSGT